jgi:hypothetical protein
MPTLHYEREIPNTVIIEFNEKGDLSQFMSDIRNQGKNKLYATYKRKYLSWTSEKVQFDVTESSVPSFAQDNYTLYTMTLTAIPVGDEEHSLTDTFRRLDDIPFDDSESISNEPKEPFKPPASKKKRAFTNRSK